MYGRHSPITTFDLLLNYRINCISIYSPIQENIIDHYHPHRRTGGIKKALIGAQAMLVVDYFKLHAGLDQNVETRFLQFRKENKNAFADFYPCFGSHSG